MKSARFVSLLYSMVMALLSLGVAPQVGAAQAPTPVVLGYYPSWSTQPAPQQIRFEHFTHLIHAFAMVDGQGKAVLQGNVPSRALTEAAHTAGVKVLLGLGGGSNGANFAKMVRNEVVAQRFIGEIVTLAAENGYDGFDIDWEYPGEGDEDALVEFVNKLHKASKTANPRALLAMALPKGNYYGKWYRVGELKDKLDIVQLMTYDFHGPWTAHAGFNAPLYETPTDKADGAVLSFDRTVEYWLEQGFSREQILVGIPFYGHGFAARSWGQPTARKSAYPDVTFKQARQMLNEGWVRHWDPTAAVPWLVSPDGEEIISYDDEVSVLLKGAWAQRKGVRGIFFWNIAQDFVDGDHLLVKAAVAGWQTPLKGEADRLEFVRQNGIAASERIRVTH